MSNYPIVAFGLDPTIGLDPITFKFTDGVPGVKPASKDRAADMNQVFDELNALYVDQGLVPAEGTLTQLRDSVRLALDTNDPNPIINGDMQVAQRPAANINSASFGFGTVDRWACKSTGTITVGGAIQQAVTTLLGSGGFALQVANLSASTAGSVIARYRMESSDARRYKNVAAIIKQLWVYQDTGLVQNYTITVNKANAQDNFTAVTNVATSANIPVASGVATLIGFPIANPADVSNGLEFVITANFSAAIAGKNFYFTDSRFHLGTRLRSGYLHRDKSTELERCRYYYLVFGDGASGFYINGSQLANLSVAFGKTMRTTPTCSIISGSVTFRFAANTTATSASMGSSSFDPSGGTLGPTTSGAATASTPIQIVTSSPYQADAEL